MVHRRRSNLNYEVIPDVEERSCQKEKITSQSNQRRFVGVFFAALVAFTILCNSRFAWSNFGDDQPAGPVSDVLPTLLSVRDDETGAFLNAHDNELYRYLKRMKLTLLWFHHGPSVDRPRLYLDRTEIKTRGALTLSWTDGEDESGDPLVRGDDIFMLRCGNENDFLLPDGSELTTPPAYASILEVATVDQARATMNGPVDGAVTSPRRLRLRNEWKFDPFPVMRQDICQFLLLRSTENDELHKLAESEWLHIRGSRDKPTAIHWSVAAADPTAMVVQFVTGGEEGNDAARGTPVLQLTEVGDPWATKGRKLTGTTTTYVAGDLCGAPGNETEPGKFLAPGQLHTIHVSDLIPDAVYQYQVGLTGGQGIAWSDTYSIRSPPTSNSSEPFAFIVYGDQGCPSNGWGMGGLWTSAMAAREVSNSNGTSIRAIHHIGDLSYAMGAAHIWDEWFAMIQPFATKVPLMVAVGNHEYDYISSHSPGLDPSGTNESFHPIWGNFGEDSGGECGVPTSKRFSMPQSLGSNGVFWYSYDMGPVHTAVLSSEHDLSPGSPQHEWLANDLQNVDRSKTPWLIVEAHRPMYHGEATWANNAVGIAMRMEFEDLLYDYNVDLFVSGHYHSYFRTCDGLYRSRCNNGGPTHITVGSAGAHLDALFCYWNWWTARTIRGEYGYGRITVANESALHFEFVKAGDANDTSAGTTLDDVWIRRDRTL